MKLNIKSSILALIVAFSLASLTSSMAQAKTSYDKFPVPKKGGTFTDAIDMTPAEINPILVTSDSDSAVAAYFFMNLMGRDPETYEFIPMLAEKVDVSKDKKEYTYTLNKKAKWSDGTPVTSDDVEFTFQKMMDPKVEAAASRSFMSGVTFQKIDQLKFKFMVETPKFNTLSALNLFQPFQKKQFEKESDFNKSRENLRPIGNAGYKMKTLSRDQFVTLERDLDFWAKDDPSQRAQNNFDIIQMKIIPDMTLKYENFLKGNVDSMRFSPDQFATQVRGTDKDKIGENAHSGKPVWAGQFPSDGSMPWFGAALNQKNIILASLKVRQALAYLVDYNAIIDRAFFKVVNQSVTPFGSKTDNVPPELRAKNSPARYKLDVKKAITLLKEDGWADADSDGILEKTLGGNKVPLKLSFKVYSANAPAVKAAQIMKETFKKAGIELNVSPVEGSALFKDFEEKNFDMAYMGWGGGSIYPDPKQLWHSSSAENKGSNAVSYSNPKVDELIVKANVEFDTKKRAKLLQEINRELYRDLPYIFIVERGYILQGINSKLKSPVWSQRYGITVAKELFHL